MKGEKLSGITSFRPLPENRERLEYAEKLGLGVSRMMNDLIAKFGRPYLEEMKRVREKELREALKAPVP